VLAALRSGYRDDVIRYGVSLAIMVPISTIILVISMVLSSAIAGGIDFGEAHTAILKAVALLLAVNLVSLVPFGGLLSLPIWLGGLMYLYNLDFWECRFLLFINWVLNLLAKYLLLALVLSAVWHVNPLTDFDMHESEDISPAEQQDSLEELEHLGGSFTRDDEVAGRPVIRIVLTNTRVTDDDLRLLRSFPYLRRLELAGTPVTDAGMVHVKALSRLRYLDLSRTGITDAGLNKLTGLELLKNVMLAGTNVTEAGIKRFRKALPEVTVTR
jgi:hypothetical protein